MLGFLLFAVAMTYLVYLFGQEADQIMAALGAIEAWRLVAATVLFAAMSLLKVAYHANLLGRITGRNALAPRVAAAYAQAQVVRYLPGKVFGLLHQANQLASSFSAKEVMLANAMQMLTTNVLALGVVASVAACVFMKSMVPLLGIVAILAVVELMHRKPVAERALIKLVVAVVGGRFGMRELLEVPMGPTKGLGTTILGLEWAMFYAAWCILASGLLDLQSTLVLATWYAAASLLSIFAIAVPAGLAVREALFISLGGFAAFPQGVLLALAAAARVAMTLGEVLCIPLTLAYRKWAPHSDD